MLTMRQRIESEIEPTEAFETVVATLVAESGKPVTKRLEAKVAAALAALPGRSTMDHDVRLTRFAGMTNIEWGGYSRSSGNRGRSILLSHTTKSEPIAERYLSDMKSHLAAKHRRNEQRRKLLASNVPEQLDAAMAKIRQGYEAMEDIHDESDLWEVLPSPRVLVESVMDED